MTLATPLIGVTPRVQEIGRIRMGEKSSRGFPTKLSTFRLTSNDRRVLEVAAELYGSQDGKGVQAWTDAPDEGQWQLTTAATELDVLIPRSLRSVSQAWELWQGGTCERRCDGANESIGGTACLCGDARGSADEFCDVVTRLSVILPRIPGLGVWRLDSGGWHAATTIPATLEFLLGIDPRPLVPAVLRAVPKSRKVREDGKVTTHRWIQPSLDSPSVTIGQLVADLPAAPMLGDGSEEAEPAAPAQLPTAAERAARKRAEIEAEAASTAESAAVVEVQAAQASEDDAKWVDADDEAAALPPLSREQFKSLVSGKGIATAKVAETARRLFPEADGMAALDDADRAALWAELEKGSAA